MVLSGFSSGSGQILLHAFSSLPSEQSAVSSHIHVRGTHSPDAERHVNSSTPQTFCSTTKSVNSWGKLDHETYCKRARLRRCRRCSLVRGHTANGRGCTDRSCIGTRSSRTLHFLKKKKNKLINNGKIHVVISLRSFQSFPFVFLSQNTINSLGVIYHLLNNN